MKERLRVALVTVLALVLLGGLGGSAFMLSGIYDVSALASHTAVGRRVLDVVQVHSVRRRAKAIAPDLDDPALVRRGLVLYRANCLTCHGAPGEPRSRLGTGVNPNPPPLVTAIEEWSPAEIHWIIENGIKMAGMPAFGLGEQESDLWALTAFVARMNTLSPAEYRLLAAAVDDEVDVEAEVDGSLPWLPGDPGFSELARRGSPARGRAHLETYGCGACHVVPGVPGAEGLVGPPLSSWGRRHYIAGHLVNQPRALVRWIMEPTRLVPGTAMPDLGVPEAHAWDMAAYLMALP